MLRGIPRQPSLPPRAAPGRGIFDLMHPGLFATYYLFKSNLMVCSLAVAAEPLALAAEPLAVAAEPHWRYGP